MNDVSNSLKIFFRLFLKYYLKYITKLVLFIHKPLVIAVSGSTNVVFTKDEIRRQLTEAGLEALSNPKNFNTEIGLPLAILGLPSGYHSYKNWLPVIWRAFISIFNLKLAKIIILALGISSPGDMKYLMSLVRPKIGVVTDINQRYLESFDDMDELVGEYEFFAKSIRPGGYLILNSDNPRVKNLAEAKDNKSSTFNKVLDKIIFFGLENRDNFNNYWHGQITKRGPNGQTVRITGGGQTTDYRIDRFGRHHLYALLAGLIVRAQLKKII